MRRDGWVGREGIDEQGWPPDLAGVAAAVARARQYAADGADGSRAAVSLSRVSPRRSDVRAGLRRLWGRSPGDEIIPSDKFREQQDLLAAPKWIIEFTGRGQPWLPTKRPEVDQSTMCHG